MPVETITIRKLQKDIRGTTFLNDYLELYDNTQPIDDSLAHKLLRVALLLLNFGDDHVKALGYRIILRYSNLSGDYQPLFDIALAKNLIPVSKFIAAAAGGIHGFSDFKALLTSAHMDAFRSGGIYLTEGQREMSRFSRNTADSLAIIAPTSYGKSELLIARLQKQDYKNACIIVPTKALLSQTVKRLIDSGIQDLGYRLLSHPDMYKPGIGKMICVFTQERLLRLLVLDEHISFDLAMIDEAHNLLDGSDRSILLSYVLLILEKRQRAVLFNFYSPFIANARNLTLKHSLYKLSHITVDENVKSERFFLVENKDREGVRLYYDQFFDVLHKLDSVPNANDERVIFRHQGLKNIIYLNRPRDIETVARRMLSELALEAPITQGGELSEIVKAISDLFHEDYNLLDCLQKGIVFHHGAMPDLVRLYVEHIFSHFDEFRHIIVTSTLLEGVNLPADRMFILSNMKGRRSLSPAQFKNLVGRVCRFREIFDRDSGSMKLLEPEIYLINGQYMRNGADLKGFLRRCVRVGKTIEDEIENAFIKDDSLLSDEEKEALKSSIEYLENIEPDTIDAQDVRYAQTEIGQSCYRNYVTEFDVYGNEATLAKALSFYDEAPQIDNSDDLIAAIHRIFLDTITFTEKQQRDHGALFRLKEHAARNFYSMFMTWREKGSSYRFMITSYLKYWERVLDPIIYVGTRWGERKRNENDFAASYVDISAKSSAEQVNLAIKKIKEEQDFVDNVLLKYVEVLNDLELLEPTFYQRVKYGTNNPTMICLLKNGFSIELARLVAAPPYKNFLKIDVTTDTVLLARDIEQAMTDNRENRLLIFEVHFHINA